MKLSNVIVTFTYSNNIVNEVKVIENRLEALGITSSDVDLDGYDIDFDLTFSGVSGRDDSLTFSIDLVKE